jgi:hypothetical protein
MPAMNIKKILKLFCLWICIKMYGIGLPLFSFLMPIFNKISRFL